ncbi:zinc finger protein 510-like [Aricia agestis]|uniref:zinc finger protein 510-like n=1 Tax=Aricia agestis TaxID=91739 RepID=UPI001C207F9F|nr:zinc finger protein 510-like [Aricia agestis]XP_041968367.1 zinc finger protein 510-like [Aricia agestis]XP_041968369.1 zinc finger protein 510-like [Aricia agestis]
MGEYVWQCCRFCLGVQTLHPIFRQFKHAEKYTSAICEVTGVTVRVNDSFPKQMCSSCVTFINKSIKFRRKCFEVQKSFENKVNIMEIDTMGGSDPCSIDISHLIDDEFNEYDDNITLDTFQYGHAHNILNAQTEIEDKKYNIEEGVDRVSLDEKVVATTEPASDKQEDKITIDIKYEGEDMLPDDKKIKRRPRRKAKDSSKEDLKTGDDKKDKIEEEIECKYCHKTLTSKLSLRNHYKIHTGFDIVCEHCGKKFITRRLLLMHCRAKHGYEKTDKCSYCEYRASNAEQVKIHERLHTGEKPFVCAECKAGFHRRSSYLQHVAIHLPEKTVQCEQCPARFKSVTLMRIHLSRHRAPRYSYACALCGGTFARRRNVARHLARAHADRADRADHHIQRRLLDHR